MIDNYNKPLPLLSVDMLPRYWQKPSQSTLNPSSMITSKRDVAMQEKKKGIGELNQQIIATWPLNIKESMLVMQLEEQENVTVMIIWVNKHDFKLIHKLQTSYCFKRRTHYPPHISWISSQQAQWFLLWSGVQNQR